MILITLIKESNHFLYAIQRKIILEREIELCELSERRSLSTIEIMERDLHVRQSLSFYHEFNKFGKLTEKEFGQPGPRLFKRFKSLSELTLRVNCVY